MDFRKWLAFGTGLGVEVREQELLITIVRVRRSETSVLGSATVTDYKTRPAAEWGTELAAFLKKVGAAHIAATVLLPRRDVIVRAVHLPGVSDKDLESAIRLQIDSLHPFSDDDVYFSWGRIGRGENVLVGIVRREIVDQLSVAVCGSRHQGGSVYVFGCSYLFGASIEHLRRAEGLRHRSRVGAGPRGVR